MGSNPAGAGTLDFLRNSPQVCASICVCPCVFLVLRLGVRKVCMHYLCACLHVCPLRYLTFEFFLFQFQALRTMVQANPQILQVLNCHFAASLLASSPNIVIGLQVFFFFFPLPLILKGLFYFLLVDSPCFRS